MNENAKAWIAALRSGKYQQTDSTLANTNTDGTWFVGFCCLGVACDLAAGIVGEWEIDDEGWLTGTFRVSKDDRDGETLPAGVQKWLGVKAADPEIERHGVVETATQLNDTKHQTFEQIADWLEANAEELFT